MITVKQKTDWCAALRSGEYKQGVRELYTTATDEYCCLGVLGIVCGIPKAELCGALLIPEIVGPVFGKLLDEGTQWTLVDMNDGHRTRQHSFSQIADWIEKNISTEKETP